MNKFSSKLLSILPLIFIIGLLVLLKFSPVYAGVFVISFLIVLFLLPSILSNTSKKYYFFDRGKRVDSPQFFIKKELSPKIALEYACGVGWPLISLFPVFFYTFPSSIDESMVIGTSVLFFIMLISYVIFRIRTKNGFFYIMVKDETIYVYNHLALISSSYSISLKNLEKVILEKAVIVLEYKHHNQRISLKNFIGEDFQGLKNALDMKIKK